MTEDDKAFARAALIVYEEELARKALMPFCERTIPRFVAAPHLVWLAQEHLEKLGPGRDRLLITAPPGSGKSTLLAAFGAQLLGARPGVRELLICNGDELAKRFSDDVRAVVGAPKYPWPGMTLNMVSDATHKWKCANGSSIRALGVGSLLTGERAEVILLDDPQPSLMSKETRDGLERWFRTVMSTRLEPGGIVVMISTRWSTDDLVSRILEGDDGKFWTHVNLPALARPDDPLGRPDGAPLWPARFDVAALERQKLVMGSREFSTQYMGEPIPSEGLLFRLEWCKRYDTSPSFVKTIAAVDCAVKTTADSDRSAFVLVGVDPWANVYVEDAWAGRVPYTGLRGKAQELKALWKPSAFLIEDASAGSSLIQELQSELRYAVIPAKPAGLDKVLRAQSVTPQFEGGKVYFKRSPAVDEVIDELLQFPGSKRDDMVDAVVYAVRHFADVAKKPIYTEGFSAGPAANAPMWGYRGPGNYGNNRWGV